MSESESGPWAHVGDPAPTVDPAPLAGFGWEHLNLPPEQAQLLRSLELAERAEERERQERLAERREAAENMALAEAARRAHLAGQPWDPSRPLAHYPSREQRVAEAFAVMDMQAAAELRVAKREAVRVLQEHGVNAQVTVDASQPRPQLSGGSFSRPPGEPEPAPQPSMAAAAGSAQRAHTPAKGPGLPRHPVGEPGYNRLRIRRFFDRVARPGKR